MNTSINGVVVNCFFLPIYDSADKNGKRITSITALTDVLVDLAESTSDYYKVWLASGIEGFCSKKYVALSHEVVENEKQKGLC